MSQGVLDFATGLKLKRKALESLELDHSLWLEIARDTAYDIALDRGEVVADDVRAVLYPLGITPRHHNAWGAVFRSSVFEFTGQYRPSAAPSRKTGMQRVWRLA